MLQWRQDSNLLYWKYTFTQGRFDVRVASIHTFSSAFITRLSIFTMSTCDVTSDSVKSTLTFYTQKEQVVDKKGDFFRKFKGCKCKCRTELNKSRSLYAKCDWNWISGYGEDVLISSMHLSNFVFSSPFKNVSPFIWPFEHLNYYHWRMVCAKLS